MGAWRNSSSIVAKLDGYSLYSCRDLGVHTDAQTEKARDLRFQSDMLSYLASLCQIIKFCRVKATILMAIPKNFSISSA